MRKFIILILLISLSALSVTSQSRGFVSYSVKNGLAQSNVVDIAEDPLGNLWLATTGGLSKFNGLEFETFKKQDGLPSNQIYCITVDTKGKIWVGTNLGLSKYDGHKFQNYTIPGLDRDQYVNRILTKSDGTIWFSVTSGDLLRLDPGREPNAAVESVRSFKSKISGIIETDSAIWISLYSGGLYIYQDQSFQPVTLSSQLQQKYITCIYADQSNEMWLGTNDGLYRRNQQGFEFMHSFHTASDDFAIYSISEEHEGSIWVGTTQGAFRYHDGTCTSVNAADGLTDNIIYKIHKDREGTLWFGSFGDGFYKSLGELFTRLDKGHGLSFDYISTICRTKNGDFWFGSYGGGAYNYIPSKVPGSNYRITKFAREQGLSNDFVYHITNDSHGNLWIGTAMGLNKYSNGTLSSYYAEDGLPSNQIFSILECRDGSLYCASAMGISRIKAGANSFENYSYHGEKHHNRVRTLIEAQDGTLLLGTQGGLKVFNGTSITDYFEIDSLKHWPITTVYQDRQGVIWCALMDDGILYYDPDSGVTKHFSERDGLSSNIVYSLTKDEQGALWAGTPNGLDKVSFDASGNVNNIRHFEANEGFFGIEANTNAVYADDDGGIWFGTVEGVYKCNPERDRLNHLEPITYLKSIRLFSEPVDWSKLADSTSGWYGLPLNLRLSSSQNHLTFEFFGNSLKNPERVTYQYTLQNFDRNWLPVTKNNTAVYTNLPPGKYTFKVRASNSDGVWNEQAAAISFEITPPFWRTWWFFASVALMLMVAGRLFYNLRVQQKLRSLIQVEKLKNNEVVKVRKRVAEDFHDQVGNQLASITVLVQLIQARLSAGNMEVNELLSKLGQFTKTLFTGTKDFIWSIDPKSDNVNEMLIYIRDFGEELFEYSQVNFHVETNNSFDAKLKLPVGWSRHVVFIFKEALTNSLKHANCKNVYLSFNVSDHNFVFELKDDGIGLNGYQDGDYLGMGLRNMKERASKIGGEIVITSGHGKGTIITLEGKIPHNEG